MQLRTRLDAQTGSPGELDLSSVIAQAAPGIHGEQQGLRIKLHIDPEEPSLLQLASLPWEFLYNKETREFVNLSRFTPIIRYLDVKRPSTPLPLEPPLRVARRVHG